MQLIGDFDFASTSISSNQRITSCQLLRNIDIKPENNIYKLCLTFHFMKMFLNKKTQYMLAPPQYLANWNKSFYTVIYEGNKKNSNDNQEKRCSPFLHFVWKRIFFPSYWAELPSVYTSILETFIHFIYSYIYTHTKPPLESHTSWRSCSTTHHKYRPHTHYHSPPTNLCIVDFCANILLFTASCKHSCYIVQAANWNVCTILA